jgi:hypothetical protein
MKNLNVSSFGARLRRAQDLKTNIQGFNNYNPPRPNESVAGFSSLIDDIMAANINESTVLQELKAAIEGRHNAFIGTTSSLKKLAVQIRGVVEAQYGKNSLEAQAIATIIKKMRSSKLVKPPVPAEGTVTAKTISRSELSYGSLTKTFNDIIGTLLQFTDYNPANDALKIQQLQAFSAQLTQLNDLVTQKHQALKLARSNRKALYDDLADRTRRVKSYVKSQYGNTSNEYVLIKKL